MGRLEPVAEPDTFDAIRYAVCAYCARRSTEVCIEKCVPEGLYRNLEPVPLEEWDNPPALPSFREFLEYKPVTIRALVYLVLHYLREEVVTSKRPLYQ